MTVFSLINARQIKPYTSQLARLMNDCVLSAPNDTSLQFNRPYPENPELYWLTLLPPRIDEEKNEIYPPSANCVLLIMDQQSEHVLASLQLV